MLSTAVCLCTWQQTYLKYILPKNSCKYWNFTSFYCKKINKLCVFFFFLLFFFTVRNVRLSKLMEMPTKFSRSEALSCSVHITSYVVTCQICILKELLKYFLQFTVIFLWESVGRIADNMFLKNLPDIFYSLICYRRQITPTLSHKS